MVIRFPPGSPSPAPIGPAQPPARPVWGYGIVPSGVIVRMAALVLNVIA